MKQLIPPDHTTNDNESALKSTKVEIKIKRSIIWKVLQGKHYSIIYKKATI